MIFGKHILGGFGILMSNMSQYVTTLKQKNILHLRYIGHQNTKTSQYMLSKNH